MNLARSYVLILLALALVPGCQSGGHPDGGLDGSASPDADADGDFISDLDEGRSERRDTDGDGILDYLDPDSDGDGILDRDEAGDMMLDTPPRDSDMDALPDYIDTDSDDNGIPDSTEGAGDYDLDGIPDYADSDDDNDFLPDRTELGGIIDPPADTDGDGRPNYRDTDSDDDLILDSDDGAGDTDGDGLLDLEDLDSDNDGIPDRDEAGDDDVFSPPVDSDGDTIPDFRDTDSDNDGLSDRLEARNGTDPTLSDSDGDGVDDLIEHAAGTDPLDASESPRTRGDFVFVVDYMEPPSPDRDTLEFRTSIQFADVYFLFDASGSMSGEQDGLAASVTRILGNLTCTDYGISCRTDGDCGLGQVCSLTGSCTEDPSSSSCIASPWTGTGYYGASLGSGRTLVNQLSLQGDPAVTSSAIGVIPADGGTEPLFDAVWSLVDPESSMLMTENGCEMPMTGRIGCPGFREEAVRILIGFTDEGSAGSRGDSLAGTVPVATVGGALRDSGTAFIGVWSTTPTSTGRLDLVDLATESDSLDRTGMPLVFDADSSGSGIDMVVTDAINEIVEGVPLRVTIEATDEPDDAGDALQFIDYLEVNVSGGRCSAISPTEDTNSDTHPDAFPSLLPGTPVCWDVVPAMNTMVPRIIDEPQVFEARVTVYGDASPLDARIIYFLVPPDVAPPMGPD
ncbi:MAG: hypothetical protein KC619_10030 [Myxococcales bacterium]|nr:hypothetical protein [Myxococcales bacterium]